METMAGLQTQAQLDVTDQQLQQQAESVAVAERAQEVEQQKFEHQMLVQEQERERWRFNMGGPQPHGAPSPEKQNAEELNRSDVGQGHNTDRGHTRTVHSAAQAKDRYATKAGHAERKGDCCIRELVLAVQEAADGTDGQRRSQVPDEAEDKRDQEVGC